jgi:hypothetical protein
MAPFVLVTPPVPNLSLDGEGSLKLIVPAGLAPVDVYLQGLVYDSTNSPPLQLANGLRLEVQTPDYSVRYAFLRNYPTGGEGALADAGVIDIDASRLKTLKPLGPNPPPMPEDTESPPPGTTVQVENPIGVPYSFLPILPNVPDAPINPLARPLTKVVGSVSSTAATIPVADTSYFPSRGKLLVALKSSNLWADRTSQGVPDVEVVRYEGKDATHFFNCQRLQVGTKSDSTNVPHVDGEVVAGEFTLATAAGARARTRVSLDADNPDLPHVVLPEFSFTPVEGGAAQTRSLDLYLYERTSDLSQGFMLFDRVTGSWTPIAGTEQPPSAGFWDPMICVAPDNQSFVAVLRDTTGLWDWDNAADQIWAVRLDGQDWPASGSPAWRITYQLTSDPQPPPLDYLVQSRRPITRCFAIVGPNSDNYVLFAGLAYKWAQSLVTPGTDNVTYGGNEAEWVREEVLVKDLIECPLVPPGSSKTAPSLPRPYISAQFGKTGLGLQVVRFDPELVVSRDKTRLLLGGGRGENEEDAFVIRNVAVTSGGAAVKTIVNVSGATGQRELRAMTGGGHGQGGKAAFSPGGTRCRLPRARRHEHPAARLDRHRPVERLQLRPGQARVHQLGGQRLQGAGRLPARPRRVGPALRRREPARLHDGALPLRRPLGRHRVERRRNGVVLVRHHDRDHDQPDPLVRPHAAAADALHQPRQAEPGWLLRRAERRLHLRAALRRRGQHDRLVARAGHRGEQCARPQRRHAGRLPRSRATSSATRPVGNLTLPAAECRVPIETPAAMRFVEGDGVQDAMVAFTAHLAGGNGSDEVFLLNRDSPFVAVQATSTALAGVHVRNVASDPWSGKVAFSRSGTSTAGIANEHPYVVDLDNFLFERDLLPTWTVSGSPIGRVMDGSFQFVAPSGSADEALVFSFGLDVAPGGAVAQTAPPAYYALSAVSNPLAEPIPTIIPLVDTLLLGADFRFYVLAAGPSTGN